MIAISIYLCWKVLRKRSAFSFLSGKSVMGHLMKMQADLRKEVLIESALPLNLKTVIRRYCVDANRMAKSK